MDLRSLLVCLGSLPAFAQGADPESVGKPYIEVGDCWSYRTAQVYYQGWVDSYEMCVTHIDRANDIVLATATVKDGAREIDLSFTLDWGYGTEIGGGVRKEPARFFKFPLRIGDSHSFTSELRNGLQGNIQWDQWSVKVIGWEEVSVPAGTFRALKIQAIGFTSNNNIDRTPVRIWWYVPEVRRYVKFEHRHPNALYSWSEELIGYRLNP